jgi:isoleucyl-tRNA synthetase
MDYKRTIQLPQTDFPMRASLPQREPAILEQWDTLRLFDRLREAGQGRQQFILHDGPPYANGAIHMGHAINKVLKDVIVKSRQMSGLNAHYVPGWDCHGLPIETRVEQDLNAEARAAGANADQATGKRDMDTVGFRQRCRQFARRWIDTQREAFQRLGIIGDWERPYLTMDYTFEADIVRELGRFLSNGSLYKGFKPVYWCIHDVTALAEAEVEYQDHTSTAIYVRFPLADGETLADLDPELTDAPEAAGWDGQGVSVVIWTTTPWTLPANLAVALNPGFTYVVVQRGAERLLMAEERLESVLAELAASTNGTAEPAVILARLPGRALEHKRWRHPWLAQDVPAILGDHVTLDAGTGCVHTAPGHGQDDYVVGSRYGLPVFNPVDDYGVFVPETPLFAGMHIREVNGKVVELLAERGALLASAPLRHSYPHCWRCHNPVITRATPQWFISMETNQLRERALQAIRSTRWIPSWGMDRIYNMVANRPDWCVSRQRSWGVPITVIACASCGEIVRDAAVQETIAQAVEQEGADAWFIHPADWFLPPGYVCCGCGTGTFTQEKDILDVWFDSGVTHAAVLERRKELGWPADLYLEGSDQHRGWFHSSLLTSVGTRGTAPYRAVLTHGFVVDGKGRKMSKSLGNVVAPDSIIARHGADILRMWVTAEDYFEDIRISEEILNGLTDAYRRIRNTLRFLLGNIHGFNPVTDSVPYAGLPAIDQWALHRLHRLIGRVRSAYEEYAFHRVYQDVHYFCSVEMGAFYLDVLKDRLYCDGKRSQERRAAQTVLHRIVMDLTRLMAPILSFTAEEVWSYVGASHPVAGERASVHLTQMPVAEPEWEQESLDCDWEQLRGIRTEVYRILEQYRKAKTIGSFLEASLVFYADAGGQEFLSRFAALSQLLIVSACSVHPDTALPVPATETLHPLPGFPGLTLQVGVATGAKCVRCWNWHAEVGSDPEHPELCPRCQRVVRQAILDGDIVVDAT